MSAQSVPNAGAVYYVTERSNAGVARVNVDATGHATVINGYISGLPGSGPDSVIFAHSGHMLVSNSDVGTMSEIDPSSRTILRSPLNTTLVPEIADMALDPTSETVFAVSWQGQQVARIDLASGATTLFTPTGVSGLGGIAMTPDGRLFVGTHGGRLFELDRTNPTHVLASLSSGHGMDGNLISQHSTGTATSNQPDVTFGFGYDAARARTSATGPAGATQYGYDTSGRLSSLSSAAAGALHFGYDPPDRLNSVVRPNGGNDTLVYDLAGQLSSQSTIANGQTLARLNYTYDAAGRRNGVTDLTCTTTLGYDPAGRLVSATHPASSGLAAESFTYDNEGNLTSQTDRSSGAVTRYTWNADHELLDVQRPDGGQVSYRYDALGRRIESNAGGVITRWVWDGSNVQLEYDASNTLQASYTTGLQAGTVMATTRSGQTTYSVQDVLRTTTTLLDASGHVSAAFAYSAFGQPAPSNPAPPAFGWAGLNRDSSTGLFFARARMYDSAAGRFIGEDPLPAANRYIYAANDPAQLIDPTGATLEEDVQLRSEDARTLIEEFAVQIKTGGLQGGERVMRILTELIKSTQGRQLVLDIHKVVAGVMGLYGSQMDPSEFRIFQIILNLTGHFPGLP